MERLFVRDSCSVPPNGSVKTLLTLRQSETETPAVQACHRGAVGCREHSKGEETRAVQGNLRWVCLEFWQGQFFDLWSWTDISARDTLWLIVSDGAGMLTPYWDRSLG